MGIMYLSCLIRCEVCNSMCVLLCIHICDFFEVHGVVCMSLDYGLVCVVVCDCEAVNVRELFKCVVVYLGGFGCMCGP